MSERVLCPAELNRATLARQLLLERAALGPVEAIERVVALQAQEPASPYVGLWSRLKDFRADQLDRAFRDRQVVKGSLFRVTLHAVSATDYLRFWPAMAPTLRLWLSGLRSRFHAWATTLRRSVGSPAPLALSAARSRCS